jgi:hypothetical protein
LKRRESMSRRMMLLLLQASLLVMERNRDIEYKYTKDNDRESEPSCIYKRAI